MGNVKSSLSNMVIVLVIITLVVGAVLGYVYQVTKEPIALSALAKQNEAIELVMPGFNNNPMDEMLEITTDEGLALKLFPAKKDGESIGVAIETISGKGYGGNIRIMVGMKPDGTIVNYEILEHKETPGLGTRMADWFKPAAEGGSEKTRNVFFDKLFGIKAEAGGGEDSKSVIGKNPGKDKLKVSKDGGDIDAITAATITSRAFLEAIETAYKAYIEEAAKAAPCVQTELQEEGEIL